MISFSVITVIGLALWLAVLLVQWWLKQNDSVKKAQDEIDAKIDAANNADDIMRESGELRDKK